MIYGNRYYRYSMNDIALDCFENTDSISYDLLNKRGSYPPDFHSIYDFLASDGMCSIGKYGITITEKGKTKRLSGGYVRDLLRQRLTYLSIIIGIAGGIITIIACFA
ncbi:MAG: hypothetical protein RR141_03905 [Rikenellaceae bacterium]